MAERQTDTQENRYLFLAWGLLETIYIQGGCNSDMLIEVWRNLPNGSIKDDLLQAVVGSNFPDDEKTRIVSQLITMVKSK